MDFTGIQDAIGKWIILVFATWPEELRSPVTGLFDVEGRWLQYKLRGVDNFGIWIENPYFEGGVSSSIKDSDGTEMRERKKALQGPALVFVRWEFIASIIYTDGQKVDDMPIGFQGTKGTDN